MPVQIIPNDKVLNVKQVTAFSSSARSTLSVPVFEESYYQTTNAY